MYDTAIGYMRQARAELLQEEDKGGNSRELSIALTHLETAILWRQEDLSNKKSAINEQDSSA